VYPRGVERCAGKLPAGTSLRLDHPRGVANACGADQPANDDERAGDADADAERVKED
jgi:hypothetical protein